MEWIYQYEIIVQKICTRFGVHPSKISQQRIADLLGGGVTKARVRAWEGGQRPSAGDLQLIGTVLGLSAEWLLFGRGEPEAGGEPQRPDPIPAPAASSPAPDTSAQSRLDADLAAIRRHLREEGADSRTIQEAIRDFLGRGAGIYKGALTHYYENSISDEGAMPDTDGTDEPRPTTRDGQS